MWQAMNDKRSAALFAAAAIAITTLLSTVNSADAGPRRDGYGDGEIVTAFSRFNNGEISAPVRPARYGWDVRLPGGTWVSCRRSCEETLRVETIDRNEGNSRDIGSGTLLDECGVFGCRDITLWSY